MSEDEKRIWQAAYATYFANNWKRGEADRRSITAQAIQVADDALLGLWERPRGHIAVITTNE